MDADHCDPAVQREVLPDGPEYCTVSGCGLKADERYNQQPFCSGHLQERLAREYS